MRIMPALKRMLGAETGETVTFAAPPDTLLFAVGDIHGQAIPLSRLLDRMVEYAQTHPDKQTRYIFLGDYVDRGLQIADAISELIEFNQSFDCVFLRGNHDQMVLDFIEKPDHVGPTWVDLGGMETLVGYGLKLPSDRKDRDWTNIRNDFVNTVPPAHLAFLQDTQIRHEEGDYLFVHAGINPNRALDDQLDKDLLWIRDEFLNHHSPKEKMIVHGHTPTERPVRTPARIGVDTGVYLTGVLTAAVITAEDVKFISSDMPQEEPTPAAKANDGDLATGRP